MDYEIIKVDIQRELKQLHEQLETFEPKGHIFGTSI